jgi:arylsulfatase A-like enzyme
VRILLPALFWLLAALCWAWAAAAHDARVAVGDGAIVAAVPAILVFLWGACWSGPLTRARGRATVLWTAHAAPPAALIALALFLRAVAPPIPEAGPAGKRGPHMVLVTLDTFRADHLGALSGGDLTPNLDALAAEGALFTQAVTTAPLTAPAHASMLTGLETPDHALVGNGGHVEAATVVPELLASGRRTGAFLSARVLDRSTGLTTGFQHYDDRFDLLDRVLWPLPPLGPIDVERGGDETVDRAVRWLRSEDLPAFLWVHLYDPHTPYAAPEPYAPTREALAAVTPAPARASTPEEALAALEVATLPAERLRYAAEIRWTDHLVGQLVDAVGPEAVVIVSGDHGEALGEHGYRSNHGALLHDPALHVPLIARWPGEIAPGTRSDALVSVAGVASLLRHAAGLSSSDALTDALTGPGSAGVLAFTPGQQARTKMPLAGRPGPLTVARPVAALRFDDAKLVADDAGGAWYDLAADPGELAPGAVPADRTADLARLQALRAGARPTTVAEELFLEALGYTER